MCYFIKNIHVNKLFHLNNFDIPIADEKYPHLIITGKNGSGKTVLLNAVSDFLNIIKNDKSAHFLTLPLNLSPSYNSILAYFYLTSYLALSLDDYN